MMNKQHNSTCIHGFSGNHDEKTT